MTRRKRLLRKLRKLRRNPVRYFDDAKVPCVRTGGLWAVAILACAADLVARLSTPTRNLFRMPSTGRVQLMPVKQLTRLRRRPVEDIASRERFDGVAFTV